jgi:hypothetical protein
MFVETIKQNNMKKQIKLTISHNEVTENYSVMCKPSTLIVELNEEKTKIGQEFPWLLEIWGQKIWDMNYPNTFGKVIETKFI